jgi:hypothetical protein
LTVLVNVPQPQVAVVLAAGGSTRFAAGAKQLATVDGTPLVAIAVQAAVSAGCFAEVIVVAGAVPLGSVLPEGVRIIENPDWASGQASSLQMAIEVARSAGAGAVVVGSAATASLLRRRASESIHVRAGVTFSATGLIGTIFGARLASIVDDRLITYLFALVVLAAAASMWRPVNLASKTRSGAVTMFAIASGVGVLTGLLGIGGGFMIVPALVLC